MESGTSALTAAATAVVLLPLLFLGGLPGGELLYPLAVVVLGGLISSTLLTLCVLPALYARFALPAGTEQLGTEAAGGDASARSRDLVADEFPAGGA